MRRWMLLVISLFVAGCGTKFVYSNLDWFIVDYVEDYIDLESEQKEVLTERLELLMQWHQSNELPLYTQHLNELIAMDPKQVTQQTLLRQEAKFRAHTDRLVRRVAPDIYALSQQLTDQQVEDFIDSLEERHKKFRDKYQGLDDSEIRQRYQERITESLDKWLGKLTEQQREYVSLWVEEVQITTFDWMDQQTRIRQQVQALLVQRDNLAYFQPQFHQLLFDPEGTYSETLRTKRDFNKLVADKYLVAIINHMTEKQTRHFREELEDWRDITLKLANN
ncbi:hypothetical protein J4N42_21310 [Vibrio sp. SCSIO 43135]|uniref:DUF6279 family lipoprotein n=1 Tax=Vibrio sp. SCSIO 43135 TaxID=2819096 RepID=UPI0020759AF5|nr:DUF6279 family lipoprotein [Vibrio sp. SCSIO 43135]USD43136.1 hypothetical protein J4N42_21310 [Vibrio sp. SCSIO 43135]